MIDVPEDFAAGIHRLAGEAGRAWIQDLPHLISSLERRWNLTVDGEPMHGFLGLVVPVRRNAERCVLKVSWPDPSTGHELAALAVWNGNGAIRILEADPALGAAVLERVDGKRTLEGVDIGEAVTVAGRLLRRLSVRAPAGFPSLPRVAEKLTRTMPERWRNLNRPFPWRFVQAACDLAARRSPAAGTLLANYDLHYGNVLAGEREPWLVIDPKVVAGDPEYGVAQLLWTRLDDMNRSSGLPFYFQLLIDQAGLDRELTRDWAMVRIVDYWLWALSVGLTQDPQQCAAIATWLDP